MAHNQRWNNMGVENDEKYDPEASQRLEEIIIHASPFRFPFDQIKREIRNGANPHWLTIPLPDINYERITSLDIFSINGDADFIQELFTLGIEPTRNMLIKTIKSGRNTIKTIDAIINAHPDMINMRGNDGFDTDTTPLIAALKKDVSETIIEHLLQRGADPNLQGSDGRSPLMYATKLRKSVIELLLRYGADINLVNQSGKTAHNHAKSKVMKSLLKKKNQNGGYRKTHQRRKSRHYRSHKHKTHRRR